MNTRYQVKGLFYEADGYQCRKYLDITRADAQPDVPELMLVLMNPGSSSPVNGVNHNTMATTAVPDDTQKQIIRVMDAVGIRSARILNLSDLRMPKSSDFYNFLRSKASKSFPHSIFHPARRPELERYFVKNIPVVYGWGVHQVLVPLAKQAISAMNIEAPLGLLKPATEHSYYHPLPRLQTQKDAWVEAMIKQVNDVRSSAI